MNEPLRIKNIQYTYPKTYFSLRAADMLINPGECVCLRGKNGSGKTTLGKIIAGLIKPESGGVFLGREDITSWPLGKTGGVIGYLFQEPARQIFSPAVLEELTFVPVLQGVTREEAEKNARAALARFEMSHLADAVTYTLSRGEKQRLAIAAMMLGNPSFVVLDEPTTGLDRGRKAILANVMRGLLESGIGILLISHDVAFAADFAGREVCIEDGRLV